MPTTVLTRQVKPTSQKLSCFSTIVNAPNFPHRMKEGKLIIVSAPSGTGKSTIIGELMKHPELRLQFSISATTRPPRDGERHGEHYYFLSTEEFNTAIAENRFAEYEEVYAGRFYGTLKSEIERILTGGNNAVLDIDVKGGVNVKRLYGNRAIAIFIAPPSIDTLRQRLEARATDSKEEIDRRIAKAEFELGFAKHYDRQVVNDRLDEAVKQTYEAIKEFTA